MLYNNLCEGWLKPYALIHIPWELWDWAALGWKSTQMGDLPSTLFLVHPTTYGSSNHSGGIWVNQIYSTTHMGT